MRGFLVVALYFTLGAYALWPLPRELKTGQTALRLSKRFSIDLSGIRGGVPNDLKQAVKRTVSYVHNDHLRALVVDRGASAADAVSKARQLTTLKLSISDADNKKGRPTRPNSIAEDITGLVEERRESYTLVIPSDGSAATLEAPNALGLFRGLTTFAQIWYDLDGTAYTLEAPFNIVDSPAYVRAFGMTFPQTLTTRRSHTVASCWILPETCA